MRNPSCDEYGNVFFLSPYSLLSSKALDSVQKNSGVVHLGFEYLYSQVILLLNLVKVSVGATTYSLLDNGN